MEGGDGETIQRRVGCYILVRPLPRVGATRWGGGEGGARRKRKKGTRGHVLKPAHMIPAGAVRRRMGKKRQIRLL